jgi:hypothetical protein
MKKRMGVLININILLICTGFAYGQMSGDFEYTVNNRTVTITKYTGSEVSLVIPNTIAGLPVTAIGDRAFHGCEFLTAVAFPDGLKSIGVWAFFDCSNIKTIVIPASVTDVGIFAFGYAYGAPMYNGLDPEIREAMVERFGIEIFECPF